MQDHPFTYEYQQKVKGLKLTAAAPDASNTGAPSRFLAGGFVGTMGMWFLMRGTPLFNAYHRANHRLVHVLFPTWVISGVAANVMYNRNRENFLLERWGPNQLDTIKVQQRLIAAQEAKQQEVV